MQDQNSQIITQIKQKIESSKSILILIPQNHTIDILAASLSFYLSLKNLEQKNINIVTSTQVTVAYQRLYGVGEIQNNLGSKSLVITLGTNYDNIEKVTYDNEGDKFNLVIETKNDVQKLTKENVNFSYRGVDADLIISLGFSTQEDAGNLLLKEPTLFSDREHIQVTNNPNAIEFGNICFKENDASGMGEIIAKIIRHSHFYIDQDIATNLISAVESATNNFSLKTTADTFAAISWCMRNGGKRNHLTQMVNTQPINANQFKSQNLQQNFPQSQNQISAQNIQAPQFNAPNQNQTQNIQPPQFSQNNQKQPNEANKDWYEPKIFRGTSQV